MTLRNTDVVYSRRLSMDVQRYHTWPWIGERQTIGNHVAQVMRIYVEIFGLPRAEVLETILWHDAPEIRMGDWPFSGEWSPEMKAIKRDVEQTVIALMDLPVHVLTEEEKRRVKICDLLDCFEAGLHQARLGSQFGPIVADNALPAVERLGESDPKKEELWRWILERRLRP